MEKRKVTREEAEQLISFAAWMGLPREDIEKYLEVIAAPWVYPGGFPGVNIEELGKEEKEGM